MNLQHVLNQLKQLNIEDGHHQIDAPHSDPLSEFLLHCVPTSVLQSFACDCVERALLREREAGREPPHQCWEVLLVKRLWLSGDSNDGVLLEARITSELAVWKHSRKRYKETQAVEQQVMEKLLQATQFLPETDLPWQVRAIHSATEAIAWLNSNDEVPTDPLLWLGLSEQSLFSGWITGWNQERVWQRQRLNQLLSEYARETKPLEQPIAV